MKKSCSFLMSTALLIMSTMSLIPISASAQGIKDFTGDGYYDVSDVVFLARYLAGDTDYCGGLTNLDITGNYVIDQVDVTAYLRYIANLPY